MNKWSLQGRTALVTGATKGIGLAIANELAGFGARVIRVARNQADVNADVTVAADRRRMFESLDRLDILVNNAGTNIRKRAIEYEDGEYERIRETNMDSVFDLSRLAHPLLKASCDASIWPPSSTLL